ncbi:Motile sperm domain-containing protein 2 isoform X1 [Oopsacas minuta]|uniref:Motile sperm domain-containing protein 2 isoform X1 n=1 Tax=Oopsacas minuta TaxID=111878 RepID=A0AAV7JC90_9METZ|nr:Motile sperm domain-containing protein 2 isoform X1 [Oopsacas minuta]
MATVELDEGEVQRVAEFLRERIRIEHSHDKDMDPRDIDRVQTDHRYTYRFARQRMATGGDENDSLKMLVTALQFRCSHGVNDLTFQDINKELLQMGICYPRGQDIEGSDIVYLLIRMHKKEKEKGEQLKRFALYFLEKHDRHFPNRKMSLFMDCSEAGYSNMDMDLVKFIISLFKQYYPLKLGSIYVYEMPWVMNAGWSIIKSWLSPAARNKMRFIQKHSIGEYFANDQLTARYGGSDPWKYQYPPNEGLEGEGLQRILPLLQNEKENEQEIKALVTEMVYRYEHGGAMPPPVEKPVIKDDIEVSPAPAEINEEREEEPSNIKKVQFRQEREQSPVIPSNNRAVNSRGIMKHNISLDNNTPPHQHVGLLLDVSPPTELLFHTQEKVPKCNITLTNLSSNLVSFKIKTTSPSNFRVQPSMGVIDSRGQFVVNIICQAEDLNQIKDDKFLIQSTSLNPDSKTGQTELNYHWRTVATELILENRLKCRISDSVNNLFTQEESKQINTQQIDSHPQNQDIIGIVRSVGNLLMEVEHMHGILKKIYTLVIGLAFINFVLIVILLRA